MKCLKSLLKCLKSFIVFILLSFLVIGLLIGFSYFKKSIVPNSNYDNSNKPPVTANNKWQIVERIAETEKCFPSSQFERKNLVLSLTFSPQCVDSLVRTRLISLVGKTIVDTNTTKAEIKELTYSLIDGGIRVYAKGRAEKRTILIEKNIFNGNTNYSPWISITASATGDLAVNFSQGKFNVKCRSTKTDFYGFDVGRFIEKPVEESLNKIINGKTPGELFLTYGKDKLVKVRGIVDPKSISGLIDKSVSKMSVTIKPQGLTLSIPIAPRNQR